MPFFFVLGAKSRNFFRRLGDFPDTVIWINGVDALGRYGHRRSILSATQGYDGRIKLASGGLYNKTGLGVGKCDCVNV